MRPSPRRFGERLRLTLIGAALCCGVTLALAMPKAAEDESAAVTDGADVAKPKRTVSTAKPPLAATKTATSKPGAKPTKPGKPAAHSKGAAASKSAPKAKSSTPAKASAPTTTAHGKK